jgi:hypothetical protein
VERGDGRVVAGAQRELVTGRNEMNEGAARMVREYIGIMVFPERLGYIPIMQSWIADDMRIVVNDDKRDYETRDSIEALVWLVQLFEAWKEGMEC